MVLLSPTAVLLYAWDVVPIKPGQDGTLLQKIAQKFGHEQVSAEANMEAIMRASTETTMGTSRQATMGVAMKASTETTVGTSAGSPPFLAGRITEFSELSAFLSHTDCLVQAAAARRVDLAALQAAILLDFIEDV